MARAKNTSRAEARRRTRDSMRTELVDAEIVDEPIETSDADSEPPARRSLFKMPDVRADLRALPGMFRSRRLLWVPLVLLVLGAAAALGAPGLSAEAQGIALMYMQFFFAPPALFTFFIAGFVAPRASYLVGLIYGLIAGVLWTVVAAGYNTDLLTGAPTTPAQTVSPVELATQLLPVGALYGTLAAAFAAWYRDFLRQMQERGKARRADREAQDRARRKTERHETRRAAKRPTS